MGVVVFVGVAFAAFRDGSEWWVTLLFSLVATALLVSLLGIIFGRGKVLAFWAGFALGGFGYLALVYVRDTEALLVTTKVARYLQQEFKTFAINPVRVRWNDSSHSSREAVVHLLAIWAVAIFAGYVASYFHARTQESEATRPLADRADSGDV
jgi:hypothetical protein